MTEPGPSPLLFTPMTIRGLTIRNRIAVSPMSQYSAVDAAPTDWHLVHLGKFAMGGAGIVFCEETSVSQRSRKTYDCPGIYTDEQAKAWRRTSHAAWPCRAQGGHAGTLGWLRAPQRGGCGERPCALVGPCP